MTARTPGTLAITLITALSALVLLGGCSSKQGQHAKWVNEADARWRAMRATALLDMAEDQFDSGQLDQAESTIRDASSIAPDNAEIYLLAGRIALENGLLERAYLHFTTCVEKSTPEEDPEQEPAPTPEAQHAELIKALRSEGSYVADAFYFRAVVLQRWQRRDEALSDYEMAAELDPEHPRRVLAVAETLVELDRVDEAAALLEEKKFFFDQNAACRALLGHIQNLRGQYGLAVENFREAALLDPENTRIQEELAFAQIRQQEWAQAATTLNGLTGQAEHAHRDDLWRALARAEGEAGRHDEARDILVNLTRRNPGEVADWIRLGELCWKMEDLGGALIAANRTVDLAPRRHEGYLLAGLVWQKRERPHEALQMFDAAADAAPTNATPVILRGIALQQSDRLAAAAEAYREALKRDPNDPRAAKLLAQLERGASARCAFSLERRHHLLVLRTGRRLAGFRVGGRGLSLTQGSPSVLRPRAICVGAGCAAATMGHQMCCPPFSTHITLASGSDL